MNKKISIITPCFNAQKYLDHCIESVINQTYSNWEMIIVDDCSTDNTLQIIKEYSTKDSRIKLIKHKKNWGIKLLIKTYNQALAKTTGEYIAILEGDDFWPKDKLESQIKSFTDPDVVLSYGDSVFTNSEGKPFDILFYKRSKKLLDNNPVGSILYLFTDLNFYLSPVTVVIKKEVLTKIGGFQNAPNYNFVDFPTWLLLSQQGTFHYAHKITGYYRRNIGSSWLQSAMKSQNLMRNEMQSVLIDFIKNYSTLLKSNNISVNSQNMIHRQNPVSISKTKNRDFTILLHYFTYTDRKDFNQIKSYISKNGSIYKVLFVLILDLLFPLRKIIFTLNYRYKLFLYRISNFGND